MFKENYISVEVAKLLKEKGMDKSYFKHYVQKNNNDGTSEAVTVCMLQMAMKWLREVHNIDIDIDAHCSMLGIRCYVAYVSTYKPYKLTDTDKELGITEDDVKHRCVQYKRNTRIPDKGELIPAHEYFDTYEAACEAAIKYCLKNLI